MSNRVSSDAGRPAQRYCIHHLYVCAPGSPKYEVVFNPDYYLNTGLPSVNLRQAQCSLTRSFRYLYGIGL